MGKWWDRDRDLSMYKFGESVNAPAKCHINLKICGTRFAIVISPSFSEHSIECDTVRLRISSVWDFYFHSGSESCCRNSSEKWILFCCPSEIKIIKRIISVKYCERPLTLILCHRHRKRQWCFWHLEKTIMIHLQYCIGSNLISLIFRVCFINHFFS